MKFKYSVGLILCGLLLAAGSAMGGAKVQATGGGEWKCVDPTYCLPDCIGPPPKGKDCNGNPTSSSGGSSGPCSTPVKVTCPGGVETTGICVFMSPDAKNFAFYDFDECPVCKVSDNATKLTIDLGRRKLLFSSVMQFENGLRCVYGQGKDEMRIAYRGGFLAVPAKKYAGDGTLKGCTKCTFSGSTATCTQQ